MATRERFMLLVINLALANSFALLNIRNTNEEELVEKLIRLIDDEKTERPEVINQIDVRRNRKDLHETHKKYEKIRRIKSRNPYGEEAVYLQTEEDPIYKTLKGIRKRKPLFIKDKNGYIPNIGRAGGSLSFSYSHSDSEDPKVITGSREGDYGKLEFGQIPPHLVNPNITEWIDFVPVLEVEKWKSFLGELKKNITSQWMDKNNHHKHGWSIKKTAKADDESTGHKKKWMLKSGDDDLMALGKRNVKQVMRNDASKAITNGFKNFWDKVKTLSSKIKNYFTGKKGKKSDGSKSTPKSLREEILNTRAQNKRLRGGLRMNSRSGEEHDPLAPGKVPFNVELHDETTVKANTWLPSYPYWNYWTYEKSLYQDNCPGNTIKVGKWCIKPPHS